MHSNIHFVTRFVRLAAVGLLAASLSACGGGGGGGGETSGTGSAGPGGNNAPTLSGSPSANAEVGALYFVSPTAQDADGDMLAFSIENLPRWAQFNTATGRLSGTPAASDVGEYKNIVITVSDGKAQQSLPQFTVNVGAAGSSADNGSGASNPGTDSGSSGPGSAGSGSGAVGTGVANVQWQPPKNGADKVVGYRIYYGTDEGTLTEMIDVPNAGVLTYVVENLAPGRYYFAITAVNAMGLESQMSNRLTKSI